MFQSLASHRVPEAPAAPPVTNASVTSPRVGLALGGGSARGWAHVGVLRELATQGIVPDVVVGTSIGAVVGACYAAGKLDKLETFARGLNRRAMFRLMDVSLGGAGLIAGARLKRRLDRDLDGVAIEDLATTFAAIATELGTGREICLSRGDLVEAIRASYAMPGIFQPVRVAGRWLFDGAMSNPVPVSVARALGADFVIAVNLTSSLGELPDMEEDDTTKDASVSELDDLAKSIAVSGGQGPARKRRLAFIRRRLFKRRPSGTPGIAGVMVGAFSIAQERISRSRLAMDPPDVMINARMNSVGLFDFHRAAELIDHGRLVARRAIPEIEARMASLDARRPSLGTP
jgi:NTE family protein